MLYVIIFYSRKIGLPVNTEVKGHSMEADVSLSFCMVVATWGAELR